MSVSKYVTADSSDDEIIKAINEAGDHRYYWRRFDWPEEGSNNTKSWVKPRDIGPSTRKNTALLKRLRKMVKSGLLEERAVGGVLVIKRTWTTKYIHKRGLPRFRVIQK